MLRKVLEAPIPYREGETCELGSTGGYGWMEELRYDPKFGPWVTKEEIKPGARPGWLWFTTQERTAPDGLGGRRVIPNAVCFGANVDQMCWPGWNVTTWVMDGTTGEQFQRAAGTGIWEVDLSGQERYIFEYPQADGRGLSVTLFDNFCATDPSSGTLWQTSSSFTAHAAVERDPYSMAPTGNFIDLFAQTARGVAPISLVDMAYDRAACRLWVRWGSSSVREVEVWYFDIDDPSSKRFLHYIYVPNTTAGIVLTPDGYVFVMDEKDWVVLYDYDGRYQNAFNQPRPAVCPNGVVWAWDPFHRRLLRVAGTPSDPVTGRSTMKLEGFYPVPASDIITPPLPRKVPRKGRAITTLTRIVGTGAEPCGSLPVSMVAGVTTINGRTDTDGDAVHQLTPAAAGALAVEVTTP